MRKYGNALGKECDMVIGGDGPTAQINASSKGIRTCNPRDKMLDHSLKQLVKDIWSDGNEDINQQKRLPKWVKHGFESHFMACGMECTYVSIFLEIGFDRLIVVPP
jgi:hypothetical protein